jgi:DNA-binding response OmpR family regulator
MTNKLSEPIKIVLLVEDDEPIIRAIERRFEEENLSLIISRDGEDGYNKADQHRPNLIILDIIIPKMDGLTMLKKIRATTWGKEIPAIVLTNLSSPTQESEASKLGVTDYLIKTDWRLDDITKKIKKILGI